MATQGRPNENSAVALYQLIGAPLLALIQAEVQSAQATAEFIERIGFSGGQGALRDREEGAGDDSSEATSHHASYGDLRMAKFEYQKNDSDGNPRTTSVQVPILSLLTIPMLQIKEAELEYHIKILDTQLTSSAGSTADPADESYLGGQRMEFRASMGREPTGRERRQSIDAQIKIKVNVEQADIPSGMIKLLTVMDESASSEQKPPTESAPSQDQEDESS